MRLVYETENNTMSVHVTSWVLRNSRATLGSRLVLLCLADYADDQGGNCWPSVGTIANETLLSVRQVQYALRHLEQLGEIGIDEKGGGRKSTRYRICMPGVQKLHPSTNGRGAMDCTPEVQPTAPDPSVEPPKEQLLAAAPRKRNEIWDTLTHMFGEPATPSATKARGKVCAELKAAGATPGELLKRGRNWPSHFDNATLTEHALVKHWHTLGRKPLRAGGR